jgi:hypothetical protein
MTRREALQIGIGTTVSAAVAATGVRAAEPVAQTLVKPQQFPADEKLR